MTKSPISSQGSSQGSSQSFSQDPALSPSQDSAQNPSQSHPNLNDLAALIQTVHHLRAPGGCPWDRAQTHQSLRPYLIEEAYEVLDVLDQIKTPEDLKKEKIKKAFCEELGDLLMQVLLHSEMTQEAGAFDFSDVAKALNDKLIRRHPHVFGELKAESADYALQRWEKEKAKEKATQLHSSILDGLPKNLPALQKASRVIEKVTKVGFQWKDIKGPLAKVDEELQELKAEIQALEQLEEKLKDSPTLNHDRQEILKKVEGEMGDLFFTICNLAHKLKITPEDSLRNTLGKFEKRFRHVERRLKEKGKLPEQSDLKEMDEYWDEAKALEPLEVWGLTGGIASGKSTVAAIFKENGIPVIDADEITRELLKNPGKAQEAVLERFKTTDRNQLREIVFEDAQAKKDLESILHPFIQEQSRNLMLDLVKTHKRVIYEATLLVETGRYQQMSGLIVVEAPPSERLKRLTSRPQLSPQMAETILNSQISQISDEERRRYADLWIENSGSLEELRVKIQTLISDQKWNSKA